MTLPRLHLDGTRFVDALGREVLLRGVNLGGDCKVPYPDGGTHHPSDFSDHRQVSFVGRPFPLAQAAEHLGRLRHWGCNCVRLLCTWEAVEHAGPGQHDQAYLAYLAEVVRLAGDHGLYVFIDFHQDVFSRMCGGSGAPGWALEAMGLDVARLGAADAALVMQQAYDYADPRPRQEERYPLMCWSRNYHYPANGVAWSLFFGGRDFAPRFEVDGVNIQDHLQAHYLCSQRAVAERLQGLPHVLGFGSLNEPGLGFIGLGLGERRGVNRPHELTPPGLSWSPLDALYACAGHPVELPLTEVSYLKGRCVEAGRRLANPAGLRVWRQGCADPFEAEGVWKLGDDGRPVALRADHFARVRGQAVDFERDYLLPFVRRVADNVRQVDPDWMVFYEKDATNTIADPSLPAGLPANTVYAPHWYDLVTLMRKRFTTLASYDPVRKRPVLGARAILDMYVRHLSRVQRSETWPERAVPLLLGEFGIPFDMNGGRAYQAWRQGERGEALWQQHVRALDMIYDALDRLQLSSTQWNYTASNRNDPRVGDGWNQEDLSVFSEDQRDAPADPDSGGRALRGFVRPYARRVQGRLARVAFDLESGRFELELDADPGVDAPCELYLPRLQYPKGYEVQAEGFDLERDPERQLLFARARRAGRLGLVVQRC